MFARELSGGCQGVIRGLLECVVRVFVMGLSGSCHEVVRGLVRIVKTWTKGIVTGLSGDCLWVVCGLSGGCLWVVRGSDVCMIPVTLLAGCKKRPLISNFMTGEDRGTGEDCVLLPFLPPSVVIREIVRGTVSTKYLLGEKFGAFSPLFPAFFENRISWLFKECWKIAENH